MNTETIYHIYHIPSVKKIGCTENLEERFNRHQKKHLISPSDFILLESHTDIYKASDREKDLQLSHGYKVDKHPYWYVVQVQRKKAMEARPTNENYIATRGIRHDINSHKVKVWKGDKVGNPRWGTLDLINIRYVGEFPSKGEAAKAAGVSRAAVSGVCSGKTRFARGYIFREVA